MNSNEEISPLKLIIWLMSGLESDFPQNHFECKKAENPMFK
jgi:hypothetical protein